MPPAPEYAAIAMALSRSLGERVSPAPRARVHGGCIDECFCWDGSERSLFVKLAAAECLPMFEAEAAGLEELHRADAVRVPRVRASGAAGSTAYLALEWLELAPASPASDARLGERLARQHRRLARAFGWDRDNTIGGTPQDNGWSENWPTFFRERRLRPQLELAHRNGHAGSLRRRGEQLLARVETLLAGHSPAPSLLHGDLWAGNRAADRDGAPVVFDPALYYGDREADIAMTRLFGRFEPAFYSAYLAAWPLDPGASSRARLYDLYHLLNHLNLFGSGYRGRVDATMDALLRD